MPRSIELFAGGGGMALGMHKAGFEHEQLVEISESACEILKVNAQHDPQLWKEENVRQLDVREWLANVESLGLPEIDLIAGGPPCQPFSISGKKAGRNDDRDMFPATIEAVRKIAPKMFAFENVPGLLREKMRPYFDYVQLNLSNPEVTPKEGESWQEHYARLRSSSGMGLRYHVFRQEINAADFGVPQIRKRVFLIGFREDVLGVSDWVAVPTTYSKESLLFSQWIDKGYWIEHGLSPRKMPDSVRAQVARIRASVDKGQADPMLRLDRWQTVRDALVNLSEPVDYVEALGIANHWGIPNARIYKGHTGSPIDWPAKVLKAGVHGVCGGEAMIRFHANVRKSGNKVRYFTIREAARVQSFDDDYMIPGTRTAAMRALGNAVAVDVSWAVGRHMRMLSGV